MKGLPRKIFIYLEMIKFEHSIFALPFAYLGLVLGTSGRPPLPLVIWVTVAMVSFRSMAMGANRLLDRRIDEANPRTAGRALPAGKISEALVWTLTILFLLVFLASAAKLGRLCLVLSPIPVLLAWIYPLGKRFTWLSHWILGIILGIAPYGAWIAGRGTFSWIPGFLTLGVTAWVAGFDIIYALQDLQFDRKYGLHSFPAHFGEKSSLRTAIILHIAAWISWLCSGVLAGLGLVSSLGMIFVALMLIREAWLIRRFGLSKIQEAFFVTNAIVSVSLFVFILIDLRLS